MRAFALFVLVSVAAAPAAAQQQPFTWDGAGVGATQTDVPWEERREPYPGGALRPGSQIDYSTSALVPIGVVALGAGFVVSVIGATQGRPEAAIPLAGAWLAAFDAFGGAAWDDLAAVAMGVAGTAQLVGLTLLIIGIATPDRYVVYDAPLGAPSPYTVSLGLDAGPGAVGLSLRVNAL